MKKLFFTAMAVCFLGVLNAQEFKAQKGDVTADFGLFNNGIFSDNAPVELSEGMLKGRYFLTDDWALRGSLLLLNSSRSDTSEKDVVKKQQQGGFTIGLGAEKHFAGTDRLSPYVGAELGVSRIFHKTSVKYTNDNTTDVVTKGPNQLGIGAKLLFGADYYVAQRVYLGVEAGLSFVHQMEGAQSVQTGSNTVTGEKRGSDFNIGTSMFGGFKLGYAF